MPNVKEYIYISDTKVNQLFEQIVPNTAFLKKASAKLGFNFLGLGGEVNLGSSEASRTQRLGVVLEYLEKEHSIFLMDALTENETYFRGKLSMNWTLYDRDYPPSTDVVYFGGETTSVILGLGGSRHHMIGDIRSESIHSHSATNYLLAYLKDEISFEYSYLSRARTEQYQQWEQEEQVEVCEAVLIANYMISELGPSTRVEFVAKRLLGPGKDNWHGNEGGAKKVILGSPLYVAYA